MNRSEFLELVFTRNKERTRLLESKGAAYSADGDAFENFKRNAEKLGLTKYQIWAVYCGKHLDSIFNAIKHDANHPVDKSEGLQGRIDDAINYLELLSGMLAEDDNAERISNLVSPIDRRERLDESTARRTNRKAP